MEQYQWITPDQKAEAIVIELHRNSRRSMVLVAMQFIMSTPRSMCAKQSDRKVQEQELSEREKKTSIIFKWQRLAVTIKLRYNRNIHISVGLARTNMRMKSEAKRWKNDVVCVSLQHNQFLNRIILNTTPRPQRTTKTCLSLKSFIGISHNISYFDIYNQMAVAVLSFTVGIWAWWQCCFSLIFIHSYRMFFFSWIGRCQKNFLS